MLFRRLNISFDSIIAKRGLNEKGIEPEEKVDVFLYRIFVTAGEKVFLLENKALREDSMVI